MIVALTGATGFVGGHLLDRLIAAGHEVRALTRRPQPSRGGVAWIAGALDDEPALAKLCDTASVAIHVAGVVNAPDAAGFDAGNRLGTMAMLHAAETSRIERFVHVSSLAAREPELSLYGASKRAAEDAVILSSLNWQVVRPPAIYGPGDTELLDMFRMAKRGVVLLPPGGSLSAIHVDDLARLLVTLAEGGPHHGFYEVDDGTAGGWTHRDFAQAIAAAVGRKAATLAMPKLALSLAARLDGAVRGPKAKLTPDRVDYFSHPDWVADPDKRVPPDLWTPAIATPDGLRDTANWYRKRGLL